MMTLTQYLLGKLAEEASEVAKEALKGQQFGTDSDYQGKTNSELICSELIDVATIIYLLKEWGDPNIRDMFSALDYNGSKNKADIIGRIPKVIYYLLRSAYADHVYLSPEVVTVFTEYSILYRKSSKDELHDKE
jgi:hypothetical protein